MRFSKLTRPDGEPVYVSETGVVVDPVIGTMPGRTRVTIAGMPHYVTESIEQVLQELGGAIPAGVIELTNPLN